VCGAGGGPALPGACKRIGEADPFHGDDRQPSEADGVVRGSTLNKTVTLALANPGGGTSFGPQPMATLWIVANP
jgi:hypothetical protein